MGMDLYVIPYIGRLERLANHLLVLAVAGAALCLVLPWVLARLPWWYYGLIGGAVFCFGMIIGVLAATVLTYRELRRQGGDVHLERD
jgi:uncharacterized membrane protein